MLASQKFKVKKHRSLCSRNFLEVFFWVLKGNPMMQTLPWDSSIIGLFFFPSLIFSKVPTNITVREQDSFVQGVPGPEEESLGQHHHLKLGELCPE